MSGRSKQSVVRLTPGEEGEIAHYNARSSVLRRGDRRRRYLSGGKGRAQVVVLEVVVVGAAGEWRDGTA